MNVLHQINPNITSATWNYSEAGHSKGPMDGVGGVLKRRVDSMVRWGTDIFSVATFVDQLRDPCEGVTITEVLSADIQAVKNWLPSTLPNIPAIMKVHQLTWTSGKPAELQLRQFSCFDCLIS